MYHIGTNIHKVQGVQLYFDNAMPGLWKRFLEGVPGTLSLLDKYMFIHITNQLYVALIKSAHETLIALTNSNFTLVERISKKRVQRGPSYQRSFHTCKIVTIQLDAVSPNQSFKPSSKAVGTFFPKDVFELCKCTIKHLSPSL